MNKHYLTVTALTEQIKQKLEFDPELQQVYVKGEISNFTHHSSGHMYFTIKDKQARIGAVMFASDNRALKFTPENGMQVFIIGRINVYLRDGKYQIVVRKMEPDGIGSLYLAYEQLKKKLEAQGYFDPAKKKPIPKYPKHIAVITSKTGAAVRDIITTIKRRYPIMQVTVIPTAVQGELAVNSIVSSIEKANQFPFDTILLGRGGGSIEELWSFNDERVAKAIYQSNIPIITGIGHETDVTISDFVADLRAPTPTGAAELAVPSLLDLKESLEQLTSRILHLTTLNYKMKKDKFHTLQSSRRLKEPLHLFNEKSQDLDLLIDRLTRATKSGMQNKEQAFSKVKARLEQQHPKNKLTIARQKLKYIENQLVQTIDKEYNNKQQQTFLLMEKLTLLNPLHVMKRGFSIVYAEEKQVVTSINKVTKGDLLRLQFIDGDATCTVEEVKVNDRNTN